MRPKGRRRASARLVPVLSVVLSIALHAGVIGLMFRWIPSTDTPAVPLIERGNGGVQVRIRASSPPREEPEPASEPQLAPRALPPPAPDLATCPAPIPMPSPSPSTKPSIEREMQEVPPLPPPPEAPVPAGRQGALTGAALGDGFRCAYPASCLRLRHEGTASLECQVDASGRVSSVRLRCTAGCGELDQSALEAARKAAFQPAREDGVPVSSTVVLPVRFILSAKKLRN